MSFQERMSSDHSPMVFLASNTVTQGNTFACVSNARLLNICQQLKFISGLNLIIHIHLKVTNGYTVVLKKMYSSSFKIVNNEFEAEISFPFSLKRAH